MEFSQAALLAAGGSVVAFWGQAKTWMMKVFSLVIRHDVIKSFDAVVPLLDKILADSKVIRWGNREFIDNYDYIKKHDSSFRIMFTYSKQVILLYKNRYPIILSEVDEYSLSVTYIPGTINIKKLLTEVHDEYVDRILFQRSEEKQTFEIVEVCGKDNYSGAKGEAITSNDPKSTLTCGLFKSLWMLKKHNELIGWSKEDVCEPGDIVAERKNYFWSNEAKSLDKEVSFWSESRNWYYERKLPWKRGAIIFGRPGGGKTKMVEEVARKHGMLVRKLNISNMSNEEFLDNYHTGYRDNAIILMEDLDSVFNMRENILSSNNMNKQLLSFDTLINAIGGLKSGSGIFLIITTNHPEVLDEALIRCGRIDAKIEVGPLTREGRQYIAENILRDWKDLIKTSVESCDGMMAADFENHCIELAIEEKNKENE